MFLICFFYARQCLYEIKIKGNKEGKRENQIISREKGGSIRKLHLVVNEYGMPINFAVTNGTRDDCQ